MWRSVLTNLFRVGLLAFFAWGLHTPQLDLSDPDETHECAREVLAAGSDPLQLRTLNALGGNRYEGEAVAKDGRVFQVRVYPESDSARMEVDGPDERGYRGFRISGLGFTSFFRNPPRWFENLCVALLFGMLLFGAYFSKGNAQSADAAPTNARAEP